MFNTKVSASRAYEEGLAWELKGDLKHALHAFKVAVAQSPEDVRCLRALSRTYEKLGKMQQAAEWHLRAEALGSQVVKIASAVPRQLEDASAVRAWVDSLQPERVSQQHLLTTLVHLEKLIAHHGPDATALRKMAQLLGRLGRLHEASQFLDQGRHAEQQGLHWH